MIWIVATLAMLVALQTLFVIGLLRSHAEMLLRIARLEEGIATGSLPQLTSAARSMPDGVVPAPPTINQIRVEALKGVDSDLRPSECRVGDQREGYLLLAFLSTTCLSCLDIWRDIIEGGPEARQVEANGDIAKVLIVLKGRDEENLGKVRALASETPVPVMLSAETWGELEVPGSPYFTLIDARAQVVVGAGSAQSWPQLSSLASDGMLELALAADLSASSPHVRRGYRSIIEQEDDELARAGILPSHPSLTAPPMDESSVAPENLPTVSIGRSDQ